MRSGGEEILRNEAAEFSEVRFETLGSRLEVRGKTVSNSNSALRLAPFIHAAVTKDEGSPDAIGTDGGFPPASRRHAVLGPTRKVRAGKKGRRVRPGEIGILSSFAERLQVFGRINVLPFRQEVNSTSMGRQSGRSVP